MILGTDQILGRLHKGQIFRPGTWCSTSIKEASYALRVANRGMIIDGQKYSPGEVNENFPLKINPGNIAILSTVEHLCMPPDLVGKLGIRLDFASRGLTGLMGIQVDPYYGDGFSDEPLYIKVANFGNEPVDIKHRDLVFNIEFSEVTGAQRPQSPRIRTWQRILESFASQEHSHWTYVTRVQSNFERRANRLDQRMKTQGSSLDNRLNRGLEGARDNQQSVVMFGVFLVAITILAGVTGLILNVRDAPSWINNWGWGILLTLFTCAVLGIIYFLVKTARAFAESSKRRGTQ